ncbi:MAG: VOC family protein [Bdellovibrio sp.]
MNNISTRLSHIEINVSDYSKSIRFYDMVLKPLGWERLVCTSDCTAYCDADYYSVLFEDPDRMKIEVVYAPRYCEKESWPHNIVSDFDPYKNT